MYKSENFQISLWLVSLMSIILLMIIVGGLTRLTESGLSMVDWRLFMGTIPPLSHGDWLKVFEDYKQYPEYQILLNPSQLNLMVLVFYMLSSFS